MNDILLYEKVPAIEKNFPVKIRYLEKACFLNTHWHEHLELLYFTDGCCNFSCGGETFTARSGDLIIVNSNELHSFVSEEGTDYFYALMYPAFFADVNFENILLRTKISKDEYIKECFYAMHNEYREGTDGSDLLIKSHAYRLVAYLMRNYTVKKLTSREYDARHTKLKRLNTVLEYISEHYQERITTVELAKMSFLNESYFCRFFKNATGKTVVNYINEIRIEKASVLLKNTDESITDVAMNVGFDDVNYFVRVFKKIKKITPGEFKKLQR